MWVYNLLDVVSTLTEAFVLYVLIKCFCRQLRFRVRISAMMPSLLYFVATVFLTFFYGSGSAETFSPVRGVDIADKYILCDIVS